MVKQSSKDKGDIGATKAIADLTAKGYNIFIPIVSEHLPFDFIAHKNGKLLKVQAKYSNDRTLRPHTSSRKYTNNDFDFYSLYIPKIDAVIYAPVDMKGATFSITVPNSATAFWWYEDFLEISNHKRKKRTYRDFNKSIKRDYIPRFKQRKVKRPSKSELIKLIEKYSIVNIAKMHNVSDVAVHKWKKYYCINN